MGILGDTIVVNGTTDPYLDVTTERVRYMFHCHVLRHEDRGMMGQFVVVEPGDEPDLPGMDSAHADH